MTTTMRRLVAGTAVAGILGTLALSYSAQAATATANLAVSASVAQNCTISAPNTLAFGSYDPVVANETTDLDADTTITVRCTRGSTGVWVGLGLGSNASGSTRRMASGADRLAYEIYSDASRSTVWGNTSGSGVSYTPSSSAPATLDVYGRVAAGQDAAVGTYSDTVVATINF
jgi:spore coat protein U-like protein